MKTNTLYDLALRRVIPKITITTFALLLVPSHGQVLTGVEGEGRRNGFDIYNASGSFGYSSYPGGFNITGAGPKVQGGYNASANAALSYARGGPPLRFGVQYVPSYAGAFYSTTVNSFNQSLAFEIASKLSAKWAFSLSGNGDDSTINQFIFKQNGLSQFVSAQGNADQFSSSIITGSASGLVGIPQTLVYGSRVLSFGANASVTHKPTPRLGITASAGFNESVARKSSQTEFVYLIPRTTFEYAGVGFTYSINTRDEVGFKVDVNSTKSILSEINTYSYTGSVGRRLTEHMFANVQAGIGTFNFAGNNWGHTFIESATLGFKNNRGDTWAITANRRSGDLYGLASSSSNAVFGSFNYRKPGWKYGLQAFGGAEHLSGGSLGGITVIQASGGLLRSLGRLTTANFAYAFMSASQTQLLNYAGGSTHAVRITVFWVPRQLEQGPLTKQERQTAFQSFEQNPKDFLLSVQPDEMISTSWKPDTLASGLQ